MEKPALLFCEWVGRKGCGRARSDIASVGAEMTRDHHEQFVSNADRFDSAPGQYVQLDINVRHFGGRDVFSGPVSTLRTGSNPATIRQAVDEPGLGRVLMIDGRASPDLACLGDMLSGFACENGWAGAIVLGAIRDSAAISKLPWGVIASRTTAKRPFGDVLGERGMNIVVGDVVVQEGDAVFVDRDAVLLLPAETRGV